MEAIVWVVFAAVVGALSGVVVRLVFEDYWQ